MNRAVFKWFWDFLFHFIFIICIFIATVKLSRTEASARKWISTHSRCHRRRRHRSRSRRAATLCVWVPKSVFVCTYPFCLSSFYSHSLSPSPSLVRFFSGSSSPFEVFTDENEDREKIIMNRCRAIVVAFVQFDASVLKWEYSSFDFSCSFFFIFSFLIRF